ncbi:MAG: PaaI family thioesterase [Desulfobaccales bacterium]
MTSKEQDSNNGPVDTSLTDNYCFVCGKDNPQGFKIKVRYFEPEMAAETELSIPREYQGWTEVIHGGILATLLDELMAHAVWRFAGPGVTLGMEVRFHKPLKPGEKIRIRGVLQPANSSRRQAEAEIIRLADGQKIASGKSRFLLLNNKEG